MLDIIPKVIRVSSSYSGPLTSCSAPVAAPLQLGVGKSSLKDGEPGVGEEGCEDHRVMEGLEYFPRDLHCRLDFTCLGSEDLWREKVFALFFLFFFFVRMYH